MLAADRDVIVGQRHEPPAGASTVEVFRAHGHAASESISRAAGSPA